MIHLHLNENPLGVSPWVRRVLEFSADSCHLYPDCVTERLKEAIASHLRLSITDLILGAGARDVLRLALETFATPHAQLVSPTPGFSMVEAFAQRLGLATRRCPLGPNGAIPLAEMQAAVTQYSGPSIVYLSHPDCHSGAVVSSDVLKAWIKGLEGRAHIIVDEAYIEFAEGKGVASMVSLVRAGTPHVSVLRTFSKAYGLAGLRVGYGIGEIAWRQTFGLSSLYCPVSLPAAQAALASLDNPDWLEHSLWLLSVARTMLTEGLSHLGIPFIAGPVNFVLHEMPEPRTTWMNFIEEQGFIIRPVSEQLPAFSRVTIRDAQSVSAYLDALQHALERCKGSLEKA